jgi:hypothetical protein
MAITGHPVQTLWFTSDISERTPSSIERSDRIATTLAAARGLQPRAAVQT